MTLLVTNKVAKLVGNVEEDDLILMKAGKFDLPTHQQECIWPWHLSILPWIPGSPSTIHTCMCNDSWLKECFYKPFKRILHD